MKISTVILSYNSARSLERCLASATKALSDCTNDSYEIFVVDNGSSDGSKDILASFQKKFAEHIKPILLKTNTGTTFSRNQAIKQTRGDHVLILDSDAYITSAAIKELINLQSSDTKYGMVVPKLTYNSGNFQLSVDKIPTLMHKLKRFFWLKKMEKSNMDIESKTEPFTVDYAISACWMLKRTAVEETGLLDENIFYSPEDVDYCIRLWKAGYKIVYTPKATIIHDAQELSRGFKLSKFHFSHLWGMFYLMKKHRYFFSLGSLYKQMNRFE